MLSTTTQFKSKARLVDELKRDLLEMIRKGQVIPTKVEVSHGTYEKMREEVGAPPLYPDLRISFAVDPHHTWSPPHFFDERMQASCFEVRIVPKVA